MRHSLRGGCAAPASTRRSGSTRAATPSRVIGLTGSMPSFSAARLTPSPSPSSGIFSGLQSTTWMVGFATSSKEPPIPASAVAALR